MSNQTVWFSGVLRTAEHFYISIGYPHIDYKRMFILENKQHNAKVVDSDVVFTPEEEKELQELSLLSKKAWGKSPQFQGMNILPSKLWTSDVRTPDPALNAFTITGRYLILSEQCGELFQQFNLGNSKLVKLQIYNMGTLEPDNERFFYFLDIAEWRHYLLPEKSSNACRSVGYQKHGYDAYQYRLYSNEKLTLSDEALNCDIDLWHDPMLWDSLFLSDRLYMELSNANIIADFDFVPCILDNLI